MFLRRVKWNINRLRSITLFIRSKGKVERHLFKGSRRFFNKLRGCSFQDLRVLVKYWDDEKEYDGIPTNDTGWYKNKSELTRTVRAFLEK